MSSEKKARERALLEEFLKKSGLYPKAKILENEHPDFILETEGSRVGIEMTEYLQGKRGSGGSEKRKAEAICESLRGRIRDTFRNAANKATLERRTGMIRFKQHGSVLGTEEESFTTELASIVKAVTEEAKFEHYDLKKYPILSKWLQRIWIHKARGLWLEESWTCPECGAGAVGITEDELISALTVKKGLADSYKAKGKCEKIVLLVCAAGGYRLSECSGDGEDLEPLISKLKSQMASQGFDEIYFYSRDGDWARRLHP